MRLGKTRSSDSTFDLNLAPVLDIIVSIIPMLLLSVAFIQVKMIESPTPQVVAPENNQQPPKPEPTLTLKVSKASGFTFVLTDEAGRQSVTQVQNEAGALNYTGLYNQALKLKELYPSISRIQLEPDGNIVFDDLVRVMDEVRFKKRVAAQSQSVSEASKAKPVEDQSLYPDVIFSSMGG